MDREHSMLYDSLAHTCTDRKGFCVVLILCSDSTAPFLQSSQTMPGSGYRGRVTPETSTDSESVKGSESCLFQTEI